MEWLVTGGAGYIGSHVVKQLQQTGFKVIVLDDLSTGSINRLDPETVVYEGNILDRSLLTHIFETQKIDGVIHLAGKKSVVESTINPCMYFEVNSLGSEILIDVALSFNAKNVIFSSTAAVYGQEGLENRFSTRSKTTPANPYGQSKLLAEKLLMSHLSDKSLNLIILRYFNVTGFHDLSMFDLESENLFALIRKSVHSNYALNVNGLDYPTSDGSCIRDYVHVEDVARAHIKCVDLMLKKDFSGLEIFNIGSGVGYSVLEVISEVETRTGTKILWAGTDRRPGDAPHVVCDIEETVEKLNWKPEISPFRDF
jgi:UDP-glucose 4-epimerase